MKPAPSQAAEPASVSSRSLHFEDKPTPSCTQVPERLGDVTRRIVERLGRRRSKAPKRVARRKIKPTPAEQRKAAFHDPRQMPLPLDTPNPSDKETSQ